jgi:hypothetical protein
MNHDLLFSIANSTALVSWGFLIVLPGNTVTKIFIHSGLVSFSISGLYLVSVLAAVLSGAPGGFGSLTEVSQLLGSKDWLLGAWVHYLAFDLLVGSWMVKDAQQNKIGHWYCIPLLVLTFMVGPVGYFAYWLLRIARRMRRAEPLLRP